MTKSQIDPAALLLAVIAAGVALALTPGSFGWLTTIAGVILLLILFGYDQQGYRSASQSLAFSAVCGFSFMLAAGYALQRVTGRGGLDTLLPLTWAIATIVALFVDRTRVSGREAPQQTVRELPAVPEGQPITAPVQPPSPAPVPAPAAYTPQEATIYVALVGEGISCLRSVKAEHLSRDIYRIIDEMPEGEMWKYQPGQVVRCKKQTLSSGKVLVAVEEVFLQRA
ncbi:MAG TPA: hypothetical protein VN737_12395 [Bryobacteraceae bacterium]|nr:hypothetical protein [Bryobacteraceae bacterium]